MHAHLEKRLAGKLVRVKSGGRKMVEVSRARRQAAKVQASGGLGAFYFRKEFLFLTL